MAYVVQQWLDGYAKAIVHTVKRKLAFDKKVLACKPGEVIFSKGQLVQIYHSDLDDTFKMECKLLPKWWRGLGCLQQHGSVVKSSFFPLCSGSSTLLDD